MGRIEIELDDKGEIVGQAPTEIEAIFKRIGDASHGKGYSKGMSDAAEAAKRQIEENVKAELAKRDALAPLEREKWGRIEAENDSLKKRILAEASESDAARKAREETHAKELLERAEAIKVREAVVRDQTRDILETYALAEGARDESLSELKVILAAFIGYDDAMRPYVKGDDGSPRLVHGKPITLRAFVKDYLDLHPHHRRAAAGQGGGARGSLHMAGGQVAVSAEQARQRIEQGDRSADAINSMFEATRKKAS
jgi:hypothetical protein